MVPYIGPGQQRGVGKVGRFHALFTECILVKDPDHPARKNCCYFNKEQSKGWREMTCNLLGHCVVIRLIEAVKGDEGDDEWR